MGTERSKLVATVGGVDIIFQGAKYFYGDKDVRGKIGVELLSERQAGDKRLNVEGVQKMKQYLVRLVAVLQPENALGVGSNTQSDKPARRFEFYCHPEYTESAMTELNQKAIDPNLLPGGYKVEKVYRKMEISRA